MHPALQALPLDEKGFVLGASLARSTPREVAARLGGEIGARCAAALEVLAAESRTGRAAALAALMAICRDPIPPGLAGADPAWIRARLAAQTSATIRTIAMIGTTGTNRAGVTALPGDLGAIVRPIAIALLRDRGEEPALAAEGPDVGSLAAAQQLCRVVFGDVGGDGG